MLFATDLPAILILFFSNVSPSLERSSVTQRFCCLMKVRLTFQGIEIEADIAPQPRPPWILLRNESSKPRLTKPFEVMPGVPRSQSRIVFPPFK